MTIAEIAFFEDEDVAYAYLNPVEDTTEVPTEKALRRLLNLHLLMKDALLSP